MKVKLDRVFPYDKIENHHIHFRNGDFGLCYKLEFPDLHTLGKEGHEAAHQIFNRIFRYIEDGYLVHFQNSYLFNQYQTDHPKGNFFFESFFRNKIDKEYLEQQSFIYFIKPLDSILKKKISNLTYFSSLNTNKVSSAIEQFISSVSSAINVYQNKNVVQFTPVNEDALKKLIRANFQGFQDTQIADIQTSSDVTIADRVHKYLCINNDMQQESSELYPYVLDKQKSTEFSDYYNGYMSPLGLELPIEHLTNQIIYIPKQKEALAVLEKKKKQLRGFSAFSPKNMIGYENLEEFLEAVAEKNYLITTNHFNLCIFPHQQNLRRTLETVEKSFSKIGIRPYVTNKDDSLYHFLFSLPGNGSKIPNEETFFSYLENSLCYSTYESQGKEDEKGIYFNSRVNNLPVRVDDFHARYESKEITNRNGIVIGKSGTGKSFLVKHILLQKMEDDFNIVVVNIGGDRKLADSFGEQGAYINYVAEEPLPLNPFWIDDSYLSIDKIEFLKEFISLIWKPNYIDAEEYKKTMDNDNSAIERYLLEYYDIDISKTSKDGFYVKRNKDLNIYSFHCFLVNNKTRISKELDKDIFDVKSLILNLEKYTTGIYKNLFVKDKPLDIKAKDYIEFELDNIVENNVLFPIFAMSISDVIFNNVWNVSDKNKMMFFDEAWKILEKQGMTKLLIYLYKTIRKFDGSIYIAIQQITDLKEQYLERAIIGNSEIKYVLDHSTVTADVPILKDKLSLTADQVSNLLSIQNHTEGGGDLYTEFLLLMGNSYNRVNRLQVSKEMLWLFESDKKKNKEYFKIYEDCNSSEQTVKLLL